MSLLNVTVKRAKYIGGQAAQLNTYVTLKLQNVKSTTVTVKGSEPCWEQDFLFETNNVNSGLLVEVWTKGMIWDRALGYQLIPLDTIPYNTEDSQGQWYPLDMDIILMDGEVAGTKNPTGHMILLDCRFELPFDFRDDLSDPESHPGDLQRKLEILNGMMTHDRRHRQAQYLGNSGYSEDSDYTSDLNYPVGQNANSSASQYRNLRTPQRSLETSRENSYEKDDRSYYDCYSVDKQNMSSYSPTDYYYKDENDPLSYNSRPMSSLNYNKSGYGQNASILRKRSLERQDTLYDDYGDSYSNDNMYNNSEDRYSFYDANSDNLSEDRQWDSGGRGGSAMMNKMLPKIPIKHSSSMIDGIYHRGASLPATPPVSHKKTRLLPQPNKQQMTSSLPATPRMLPQPKSGGKKMPITPMIKRTDTDLSDQDSVISQSQYSTIGITQSTIGANTAMTDSTYSIRPHTSVSSINYNEDYNYAYRSTDSLNQSYSDTVSRRKGAALPTIPATANSNKIPKFGQNQNNEYNSLSFDMDSTGSALGTSKDYYNDGTNDDYFYENNLSSSTLHLSTTRKSKRLPTPVTSLQTSIGLSSSASMYSSTSLLSKISNKHLPQIPIQSSAIGVSATTTPVKQLPSTPLQSTSIYDTLYTPTSTLTPSTTLIVNDTYNDSYGYTSTYSSAMNQEYDSYLYDSNKYDTYDTQQTYSYETNTYDTSTYATSNFTATKYELNSVATPVASVTKSFMSTSVTTTTTTIAAATTTTSSSSAATYKTTSATSSHTTSVLGSLTSGFKATMGGVVGGNLTGSTSQSGATSSATGYLGLMSKFLPNLTGNSSSATTTNSSLTTAATTTKPVTTTISYTSSVMSNNKYTDDDYSYYNTPNNTTTTISSINQQHNNSSIYGRTTTATTSTQQQNDIYNYNSYYNSTSSNYDLANDATTTIPTTIITTTTTTITTPSIIPAATTTTTSSSGLDIYNMYGYDATKTKQTTTTASATSGTSATSGSTGVDYSDDYKYGYDDYSYSENDYIATGDITDKANYNNNYDIYDTTTITTTSTSATFTTTPSTTISTIQTSGINKQTSSSSVIYDYDYDNSDQYSHDINTYNNRNTLYCDNSSNITAAAAATTTITQAKNTTMLTSTSTPTSLTNDNQMYKNVINDYYMDQNQTTGTMVMGNGSSMAGGTVTATATATGKKLPKINGKSNLLMKQQTTEIYEDDDELPMHDVDEEDEDLDIEDHLMNDHSDQDDYYMDATIKSNQQQITNQQHVNSNEYGGYNANDTPYYDYRDDYFNEEDEYKYLEKEQQQQQQQQRQQHQKQPPLDFIEEARDDYMDNHIDNDNEHGDYDDNKQMTKMNNIHHLMPHHQQHPQHHHQLSAQDTIDDSSQDYLLDQQKNSLKKQESILEEDEEQVPSPSGPFPPTIYDQKDLQPLQLMTTLQPKQQDQSKLLAISDQPVTTTTTAISSPATTTATLISTTALITTTTLQATSATASLAATLATTTATTITSVSTIKPLDHDVIADDDVKKKTITRGETEEVTSGPIVRKSEITARQRWNWAYNKIIMQLNIDYDD